MAMRLRGPAMRRILDDSTELVDSPSRRQSPRAETAASRLPARTVEALLTAALTAHKSGAIGELLAQRPRFVRWLEKTWLAPVLGTAGDAWPPESARVHAVTALLHWSVFQLRPDRAPHDAAVHPSDWLEHTSWRPFLAVACHHGFLSVPDFPTRYRRHADESAADNLCGIWAVGPSTFYRYLDKGKRQLAEALHAGPVTGARRHSLRRWVHHLATRAPRPAGADDLPQWHQSQALSSLATRDCCSALWHLHHAAAADAFVDTVQRYRIELAGDAESDDLIERFAQTRLGERQRCALLRWHAELLCIRNQEDRARRKFEEALRIAHAAADQLMVGIVIGALGKFHEQRDTDKALACFQDSAEFLRRAVDDPAHASDRGLPTEYVGALQKLAWTYVLRNDPRSRTVLERADAVREAAGVGDEATALVDQAWGEYWRRSGDLRRAIEHHHRVLNIFERLGDTRQILSTYNNLALIYVEGKDYERAIRYGKRVTDVAAQSSVDPLVLASAYGNLGIAYFWQERHQLAIEHYRAGLEVSERANLRVLANRAHFNLAEAYYTRFKRTGDVEEERLGDAHLEAARTAAPAEGDAFLSDAVRELKAGILAPQDGFVLTRLVSEEAAAHAQEMSAVHVHRATLAVPDTPERHVRAHLAIANAYLAISTKEREAALALIRQHALGNEFDADIDALQMTFSRELTREKVLTAQWKQKSYGVLTEERASAVLQHVLQSGSINKSGYAQLCQVGLATASKHLGTLAERGLLVQTGKGPSTRYMLP